MKHLLHRWLGGLVLMAATLAAQGHGDEPHGDEPHPVGTAAPAAPRFEASTDLFEMVGRLEGSVLTLDINRFATNEPLLQARIELESGDLKAVAAFRADQGNYQVDDARFVQALRQPGAHALVITVTHASEADLLDATLEVSAPRDLASRATWPIAALAGTGLGLGVLAFSALLWRRRRTLNTRGRA